MTITQKNNLSIIVFTALIILIAVFIIYPLFGEIKNSSKELVSQRENSAILEAKIKNLEEFKVIYKNLEESFKKIDSLFINSEAPVEFIGFLESTSEEYRLKIEILSSSVSKTEKDFWPNITFQINTAGSFSNFLKFMEKIENSPYLIEIQNLNIGRSTGSNDIKASFSIKVFTKY